MHTDEDKTWVPSVSAISAISAVKLLPLSPSVLGGKTRTAAPAAATACRPEPLVEFNTRSSADTADITPAAGPVRREF